MEVGEAVLSLNLVNAKFNLAERLLFVLVEVTERDLDDTALERVVCVFCAMADMKEGIANERNPTYSILESDSQESCPRSLPRRLTALLCHTNLQTNQQKWCQRTGSDAYPCERMGRRPFS